jgi:adenosylcobinamide-GDP ribazoletransferase
VALLSSFQQKEILSVLILMPVAGRIGSLVGSGFSVYARRGEGLGKSFIECCGFKEVIFGTLIYSVIFYAVKGLSGLALSIVLFITALILVKFLSRKIGGATGDILGAVCELNQCIFLIAIYIERTNYITL